MRALRFLMFGFGVSLCIPQAWGQGNGAGVVPGIPGDVRTASSACDAILHGRAVPFSADVLDSTDQQLADGTKIHRETRSHIVKDSAGRVRTDTESVGRRTETPVHYVTIQDPIRRVFISLDPTRKTATVRQSFAPAIRHPAPVPMLAATSQGRAQYEDLGSKEIEGFVVYGRRSTSTAQAGELGNDRPMTSIHETWESAVLNEPLLTISDDPLVGHRVRKVFNIKLGEPEAALFVPPPDYVVKEQPN